MTPPRVLTPELMYRAAVAVALVDVVFTAVLAWRIGTEGLRRARLAIPLVAGVYWFGVWRMVDRRGAGVVEGS